MINLYINEIKKIVKTKLFIFFVLILIASSLLTAIFSQLIINIDNNKNDDVELSNKEINQIELNSLKSKLSLITGNAEQDITSKYILEAKIKSQEYILEEDIIVDKEKFYWKLEVLKIIETLETMKNFSLYKQELTKESLLSINSEIEMYNNILKTNDFERYMVIQEEDLEEKFLNKEISYIDYQLLLKNINITQKYKIGKSQNELEDKKLSIANEIMTMYAYTKLGYNNSTNEIYLDKDIEKLNDKIKINEYILENDLISQGINDYNLYRQISETSLFFVLGTFIVIFSVQIIVREFKNKNINLLFTLPKKRYKILISKILAILTIILVFVIVGIILNYILSQLFFGNLYKDYITIENKNITVIPNFIYILIRYFLSSINILAIAIFAMMMGSLTLNSNISIVLSIILIFSNNIINKLITALIKKDWINFIPSLNFDLVNRVFNNTMNFNQTSVMFSCIVIIVTLIIIATTLFDSYTKKEIK